MKKATMPKHPTKPQPQEITLIDPSYQPSWGKTCTWIPRQRN